MTIASARIAKLLDLIESLKLRIATAKHFDPCPLDSTTFKRNFEELQVILDKLPHMDTISDPEIQEIINKVNTLISITHGHDIGEGMEQ